MPAARSTRRSSSCCRASARRRDLEALGIPVVADLPGVGAHLQDHLEVYIQYKSLQPVSMQPTATQKWRRPFIGAQWLFLRSGPGATNHFEGGGFARSNDDVAYPNLMFHFLPLAIRYDGTAGAPGHGYQVHVGPMYSDARGIGHAQDHRPARPSGAALQLPLDRPGPARVGRGRPRRAADPRTSRRWRPTTAARRRPARPSPTTTRSATGSRATPRPRSIRRARRAWAIDGESVTRPADDAGPRPRRAAGRGRLGDAVRHERRTSTPR